MADQSTDRPESPTRRGGLGRGLGALIPSAPIVGTAAKGHFWTALDNPPPVDDETQERLVAEVLDRASATSTALPHLETAGQAADERVDQGGTATQVVEDAQPAQAVDIAVDATAAQDHVSDTVGRPEVPQGTDSPDPGEAGQQAGTADPPVDEVAEEPAAILIELHPDEVRPNPKNPRQVFDDDELAELGESIREFGLLQPIVVRDSGAGYELIMGERRLRAARMAGVDRIPVIVRQTEDDAMLRDALLENIHRVQLHPLEEAAAYQQLIDEFGVTHEELASRIKRSRPAISNTIRLLKLPVRVQNRVAAGVISGSHARALLSLEDAEAQDALATRIVAEGMSVRATEEAVSMHVGEATPTRRAARRKNVTAPALVTLAERLSDHFDTRAVVQLGRSKGKIVVEFASIDDLERIIAMMAPPLATSGLDGGAAPAETALDVQAAEQPQL